MNTLIFIVGCAIPPVLRGRFHLLAGRIYFDLRLRLLIKPCNLRSRTSASVRILLASFFLRSFLQRRTLFKARSGSHQFASGETHRACPVKYEVHFTGAKRSFSLPAKALISSYPLPPGQYSHSPWEAIGKSKVYALRCATWQR